MLWILLALPVVFALGWFAAVWRREWIISRHTRCVVCLGAGCYHDATLDFLSEQSERLARRGLG